jgi:hypothetical protein
MQNDEKTTAERLRLQGTTLAEFGLHAFRTDDLEELLHRAAELVADGLRVRRAKVLELMRGGKELLICAGVNWDPGGGQRQVWCGRGLARGLRPHPW